jgi:MFS transporter, Spinster family, sphingosine-1-phosphate transporter
LKGEHDEVLGIFVVVCVTGPVLGIIVGGSIVQKYAGGYEGKHSITFSLVFALLAFLSSIPIRFLDGPAAFGITLWAVLLFGGAVIPNVQGIMISSLKSDLRAAGNSVSNIMQNLIGFLPAPLIYGFIFERTKDSDPKLAMCVTLYYSSVGVLFIALAFYYRNYKYGFGNERKDEQIIEFDQVAKSDKGIDVVNKRVSKIFNININNITRLIAFRMKIWT